MQYIILSVACQFSSHYCSQYLLQTKACRTYHHGGSSWNTRRLGRQNHVCEDPIFINNLLHHMARWHLHRHWYRRSTVRNHSDSCRSWKQVKQKKMQCQWNWKRLQKWVLRNIEHLVCNRLFSFRIVIHCHKCNNQSTEFIPIHKWTHTYCTTKRLRPY